jgi:hypothetical protein
MAIILQPRATAPSSVRPVRPLKPRLPEPTPTRKGQNILGISSTAWNNIQGSRNAISTL